MAKKKSSLAVRFLWIIAGLTVLVVAGALAYRRTGGRSPLLTSRNMGGKPVQN